MHFPSVLVLASKAGLRKATFPYLGLLLDCSSHILNKQSTNLYVQVYSLRTISNQRG